MTHTIKFTGIDNYGRPVYKVVDKAIYYGSADTLFHDEADQVEVDLYFKDNSDELEYFGTHFGCEPNGGRPENLILKIN